MKAVPGAAALLLAVTYVRCLTIVPKQKDISNWEGFKAAFSKDYKPREEAIKEVVFKSNKQDIKEHNYDYRNGKVPYKLAVNKLTDMMPSDVRSRLNGFKKNLVQERETFEGFSSITKKRNVTLPFCLDWRNVTIKGRPIVPAVIDQGMCASCYAIAVVNSIQCRFAIKKKKHIKLSSQNVVDCSNKFGNYGCSGGLPDNTYKYMIHNSGINTEQAYPYVGEEQNCKFDKSKNLGNIKNWVLLPKGDEESLKMAVATMGPLPVAVDGGSYHFQMYGGGIFDFPGCKREPDHVVLLVGYCSENGTDYWIVQNSWGTSWGEKGYMRMVRNKNMCSIANHASFAVL